MSQESVIFGGMCSRGLKRLFVIDLGRTRYKDAWDLQKRLVKLRSESRIPDMLLLTEHEPVITMGRGTSRKNLLASEENLAKQGIDLFEVERGGDITFHGPGQCVLYPIIDLNSRGRDMRQYLRDLENLTIFALADLGLKAETKVALTGVWVGDCKVAAIGVAVSHWVTYHGLALNVTTNLDYFQLINPCGITDHPVGSVTSLLGKDVGMDRVKELLAASFAQLFYYEMDVIDRIDDVLLEIEDV